MMISIYHHNVIIHVRCFKTFLIQYFVNLFQIYHSHFNYTDNFQPKFLIQNYVEIRYTVGPHVMERIWAINSVHSPVYQSPPPTYSKKYSSNVGPKQMNEKCTFKHLEDDPFCLDFVVPGNPMGCLSAFGTIVGLRQQLMLAKHKYLRRLKV